MKTTAYLNTLAPFSCNIMPTFNIAYFHIFMAQDILYSIIESPGHPDFAALYGKLGLKQIAFQSIRKAISQLKKQPPDFIVAEFFYGYSNNYAGVNISNLDVLLSSLQKYAPEAKVIVFVDKSERRYVDKLNELFPLHCVLPLPVQADLLEAALTENMQTSH